MTKRLFDIVIAGMVLYLTSPLFVLAAFPLKTQGRGPIFHRSPRVGKDGKVFAMLSFRTMDDEPADLPGELRLTPAGRFTRNYSLDHLPQLVNVLRGDMSIIGPRPTEPHVVDLADPAWREVLTVRPGTCSYAIFRLARGYNRTPWPERLALEREYIRKQSLGYDLVLLKATLRAIVQSRFNVKARGLPNDAV